MAAVLERTEVGIQEFETSVNIPENPKAKLMYYFECICSVLDLSDQENLCRLRDFKHFYFLTESETSDLIALVHLYSPDELNEKTFFEDDDMCGDSNNAFFELNAVRHRLLHTDTILIGGQRRSVKKIMAYKRQWIDNFWTEPVTHFETRLRSINSSQTPSIENQPYDYNAFNNFRYIKRRSSDTDSSDTDSSDTDSSDTDSSDKSMSSASTPTIENRAYAYKIFNNRHSSDTDSGDNHHSRCCNII